MNWLEGVVRKRAKLKKQGKRKRYKVLTDEMIKSAKRIGKRKASLRKKAELNLTDDMIDSRDIIERLEELRSNKEDAVSEGKEEFNNSSEGQELEELEEINEEGKNYSDWEYGETLIMDSYFREYAEDLANDIGAVSDDNKWPLNHIDWEAAAHELSFDYGTITIGDNDYYIRN